MHILRHAHEVSAFIQTYTDQAVATLIQQCLSDLLHGDDLTMEELVFFVVPDPGETIQQLVEALGTDLQTVDGSPCGSSLKSIPPAMNLFWC